MQVKDVMTRQVIPVGEQESVSVAARSLTHYNIGALPVMKNGTLCGMVTDRDIVTRCLAANRDPEKTTVGEIMTRNVHSAQPSMELGAAAHLMGRLQVRRLPVVENGKLQGMLSLGDLSRREDSVMDAADALTDICTNVFDRGTW